MSNPSWADPWGMLTTVLLAPFVGVPLLLVAAQILRMPAREREPVPRSNWSMRDFNPPRS